jgi:hypothetical protein
MLPNQEKNITLLVKYNKIVTCFSKGNSLRNLMTIKGMLSEPGVSMSPGHHRAEGCDKSGVSLSCVCL